MNLDIASPPRSPSVWCPSVSPSGSSSESPPVSPPAKRPREVKLPEGEAVQPMKLNLQGRFPSNALLLVEGGTVREAAKPKRAAGYCWIKLIHGDTELTEAEKQKANEYSLTEFITRGIRFCTICGDEEHWTYLCPEFPSSYKRPTANKKKRRNPEDCWQQSDEDRLHENCITAREIFEYLQQFSPKKNIHRTLLEQDRMIQMLENANGRPVYKKFWEERHTGHRMHCRNCGMVDDHWSLCCPRKGQLDMDTDLTQRGKDSQSEGAALDAGHMEIADEMKE